MATTASSGWSVSRLALIAAAVIAIIAIAYAATRERGDADAPAAQTSGQPAPSAATDPQAVIRMLQERVGANPRDGEGWALLGQAYFMTERYADAARSYRRATEIEANKADYWSAYGEATVMASERDPMPADALAAFQRAASLDPKDARARYFLAVARDLKGDHQGAIDDWLVLLADTPAGAPWEADLRRTIEQVGKIHNIQVADRLAAVKPSPAAPGAGSMPVPDAVVTSGIPGPTREQMQAAAGLPKGAQDQMVQGMIGSLEAKLKANPANVDGWIMLMRSRMTLGETAKAAAARDAAVSANPAAAKRLRDAAATLGIPGS